MQRPKLRTVLGIARIFNRIMFVLGIYVWAENKMNEDNEYNYLNDIY